MEKIKVGDVFIVPDSEWGQGDFEIAVTKITDDYIYYAFISDAERQKYDPEPYIMSIAQTVETWNKNWANRAPTGDIRYIDFHSIYPLKESGLF